MARYPSICSKESNVHATKAEVRDMLFFVKVPVIGIYAFVHMYTTDPSLSSPSDVLFTKLVL